jgi:hypothetical protein
MTHLTKIAELDRRWFLHHPGRCYRARYATPAERHVFEGGDDLVLLIRYLGRGVLVHQPVKLACAPPASERTIAMLFARAVEDPLPIPVLEEPEPELEGVAI